MNPKRSNEIVNNCKANNQLVVHSVLDSQVCNICLRTVERTTVSFVLISETHGKQVGNFETVTPIHVTHASNCENVCICVLEHVHLLLKCLQQQNEKRQSCHAQKMALPLNVLSGLLLPLQLSSHLNTGMVTMMK